MKLKFSADPDDWLIFLIFAIVLLYVISIGVVNLSSLISEGTFSGLNPFLAFTPEYITVTFVFYILALLGLFLSVNSYFFERDKGFGFSATKKDKGYSRWAKDKEIKEELKMVPVTQGRAKAAGIPIIINEKEMWVDDSEYHSLVIGATGSGKTQAIVFPQVNSLAKAHESMIITDPKGEIYEKTSIMLRKRGYQILLLNFRDPQRGNAWNPMTLPYRMYKSGQQDKAIELLDDLALNILYDESNKNSDPFWEKTSADYFSGIALGLFEDAKEDEININSISLISTVGEEKFGGSKYINEYFNTKDPSSAAYTNAASTILAPSETKGSILSVFKQKVKLFASRENLSEMLSYSDINLESIGERPTAVFIVIQDEKKTYHPLVTILLKQIYETLIDTAQKHGGKLPVRTNFILDEFANMPPLKDVTTMITAARSRRIRFTMIIQNFAQLDSVYGHDDAETIRGNCGNIIYLITTELKALEEISKMCGEVKSKKDDKTASTPLVTVSDLQRLKQYETIIMRMRKQPFKTKLIPNYKLNWGFKFPDAKYPLRRKREVHTFDIKEFVKAEKKKKLMDMMNSDDSGSSGNNKLPSSVFNGGGSRKFEPINGAQFNNPFARDDNPSKPISKPTPLVNKPTAKPVEKPISNPVDDDDDFGFDVDDLVKKIDAKIAQLEEEERREKEEKEARDKSAETIKKVETEAPATSPEEIKENVSNVLSNIEKLDNFNDGSDLVQTKDLVLDDNTVSIPKLDEILYNNGDKVTNESKNTSTEKTNISLDDNDDDDDFFDDFFDN